MTNEQIEEFCRKRADAEAMSIKAKILLSQAGDDNMNNNLSCDHRKQDGNISGAPFQGSYCGFICQICGCSVSYERMGY